MTTFWIVIAIIEFLLIAAGVLVFVLNAKKQEKIADSAKQMAKGKINLDDIPVSGTSSKNDVIAGGLNLIKSNLLTFVESTKQNTVVLADAIEKLTGNMEANKAGTEHIAENTIEVEERTGQQRMRSPICSRKLRRSVTRASKALKATIRRWISFRLT